MHHRYLRQIQNLFWSEKHGLTTWRCLALVCLISAVTLNIYPPLKADTRSNAQTTLTKLLSLTDSLTENAAYIAAESVATIGLDLAISTLPPHSCQLPQWFITAGRAHLQMGSLVEAESLLQTGHEIQIQQACPDSLLYLASLRSLYWLNLEQNDLPEAEKWINLTLTLSRQINGERSAATAVDMNRLATLRLKQDASEEAIELLSSAINLVESEWGADHEALCSLYQDLGTAVKQSGQFEEAVRLYQHCLPIAQKHWGMNHPKITGILNGLAVVYRQLGKFKEAEALYQQCLDIRVRANGPDHPGVAAVLNNLSVVLYHLGDYTGAAEISRRCLAIRRRAFGDEHGGVAVAMMNLSFMLSGSGHDTESISLCRQAIRIMENLYGPDHTQTARALNRLAVILRLRGELNEAEALFRRCLGIVESTRREPHPDGATYKGEIAFCLLKQGRLTEAEQFFEAAVSDTEILFGRNSSQIAVRKRGLGHLLLMQGKPDEALAMFEETLAILEEKYGPDHTALLISLEGLVAINIQLGLYDKAHQYADRFQMICTHSTEANSVRPVIAKLLYSALQGFEQKWEPALEHGRQAVDLALAAQADLLETSCEQEAILYASLPKQITNRLVGILHQAQFVPDETLADVFALVAGTHGQVLDLLAHRRRRILQVADSSETSAQYRQLISSTQQLANLSLSYISGRQVSEVRLAEAREAKRAAERSLAESSSKDSGITGGLNRGTFLSAETIGASLETNSVMVQMVRFPLQPNYPSLYSMTGSKPELWRSPGSGENFGAFYLYKPESGDWQLKFQNLGNADSLDESITTYLNTIESVPPGYRPTPRDESLFRQEARALYKLLWEPMGRWLEETGHYDSSNNPTVFIIPESHLHRIDFNTLLGPEETLVIENWRVHLLSSSRDMIRFSTGAPNRDSSQNADRSTGSADEIFIVGNPELGNGSSAPDPDSIIDESVSRIDPARGGNFLSSDRGGMSLPGAELEAKEIAEIYQKRNHEKVTLLIGPEATETAVKQQFRGKSIIHLATHGFYCNYRDDVISNYINPLVTSGLHLAVSAEDDGWLTAQELIGLDLGGLDWVVLSSCNSALGQVIPGEGLAGLRRAFEIAGAKTTIMALWRIGDLTTRELMCRLYQNRLSGLSTIDAIREAELDLLRNQRNRYGRIHPTLWGGIVAEGAWK